MVVVHMESSTRRLFIPANSAAAALHIKQGLVSIAVMPLSIQSALA